MNWNSLNVDATVRNDHVIRLHRNVDLKTRMFFNHVLDAGGRAFLEVRQFVGCRVRQSVITNRNLDFYEEND